jgi:8-oxo-dGTP diphosphatase
VNRPLVGVGVIILNNGKVLLGKGKNSHGAGSWSFPSGHLEFKESIEACARREVMEEVGIEITNIREAAFTNDLFPGGRHYITLFVLANPVSSNIGVMEPNKCERWEWFSWDNLPKPLFIPVKNLLRKGYNPTQTLK